MMAGLKKNNSRKLGALLPELVQDRGWEQQLDLHSIFPRWKEIVGEEMDGYARPLKIDKGVLWLEVANSAWLQQLQYEKLELLDSLNSCFRLSRLKDIRMVLPRGKGPAAGQTVPESDYEIRFIPPDEKKVEKFRKQVECIDDEKCREALMQFWYLAQACRRKRK